MQCPKCGFNNPDNAKFCQKCANAFPNEINPEQNLHQQNNPSEHQKSKKLKIIVYTITSILIIGGLAFAGYYYRDKLIDLFGRKGVEENLVQNTNQVQNVNEQKHGEAQETENKEESLIYGNYEQLVLSEPDVQSKFWFMILDEKKSKEIKNISELEAEIKRDVGIDILGGYQNEFKVDLDRVFTKIEKNELEGDVSGLSLISSKVVAFKTIDDAHIYLEKIKKELIDAFNQINDTSSEKEDINNYLTTLDNVGDEGFRFNLVTNRMFFRIKNGLFFLTLLGDETYFTNENALYLTHIQADKYKDYRPSQMGAVLDYSLDSDNDGLKDHMEDRQGTDKNNPDTDGDSYQDGDEVKHCYDPLAPGRLIEDSLMNKLTDREYLKTQGLYYPQAGEDVLSKLLEEKDFSKDYDIFEPESVQTGIFAQDKKRYFLVESSIDKFYFTQDGSLELKCPAMLQTDQEKIRCQLFDDKNNFEIDCERDIE